MADVGKVVDKVDGFQQRHAWAAIPFGVYKKFSEDQAGNLAALISYYAFFSIFPLLLALTTVLGFVLSGNPGLRDRIYNSAAGSIPVIGQNSAQHPLKGSVFALVLGLLLAIWSGLAVASQAQSAFSVVWTIPRVDRPGFVPKLVRNLELVAVVGGGLIVTTLVQGFLTGSPFGLDLGVGIKVLGAVVGIALDVVLIVLLFRRGTALPLTTRQVLPGAIVGGIGWFVLQKLGTYLINNKVSGSSGTYGTFAVVIGLLSYFFLLAQVTLYAAELNVVLTHRLWPRGLRALQGVATTEADERAYSAYPERERQAHDTAIGVDVDKHPDGQVDPGDPDDPDATTAPANATSTREIDGNTETDTDTDTEDDDPAASHPAGAPAGDRDLGAAIRRIKEREQSH